jgi:hypothetical protein
MTKPNPLDLLTGDIVHCDGGPDGFSVITRIVTGPKDQNIFKRIANKNLSTHTGIIATFAGQRFVVEMRPNGCEPNSLEFYRIPFGTKPRAIIEITRLNCLTDSDRVALDEEMATDIRRGIEYPPKELIRFVLNGAQRDDKRMYCSEYVWNKVSKRGFASPKFDDIVSPRDLQLWGHGMVRSGDARTVWHR